MPAVDYPKLVEGEADYILYASGRAPWDHVPGSLLLAEAGGLLGTTEGPKVYSPRDIAPPGLVAAASPAAYEHVCRALTSSAHLT